MITIPNFNERCVGKLGNKMFLLAAAIGLAKENNDEVVLSPGKYADLFPMIRQGNTYPEVIYKEKRYEYDKIPYTCNMGLKGYFQSWKYFRNAEYEIRECFDFCFGEQINATSVHVRRGDYVGNKHYVDLYEDTDYYIKAMSKEYGRIIVFSDDIEWCKKRIKGANIGFAEGDEIADMKEMARCNKHIIANSSFSWWGAWLGYGKVIYPKQWFGEKYSNLSTVDLIPNSWEGL